MSDSEEFQNHIEKSIEEETPQRIKKTRKLSAEHLEKMRKGKQEWCRRKREEKNKMKTEKVSVVPEEPIEKVVPTKSRTKKKKTVINNYYIQDEESSSEEEEINNFYSDLNFV